MKLLIITGMSGAGKSVVANDLEDMGFYCVDNIPPAIIPAVVSISQMGSEELERIAVVTDIRGGEMFSQIQDTLKKLDDANINYKILFLDANDDVIINRYRENRRKHPLCDDNGLSLDEAVSAERKKLQSIREKADYVLDTSGFSAGDLKTTIADLVLGNSSKGFSVICKSFGFKYGYDTEADLVFDVRCLPNPFYIENLKRKTGQNEAVKDYIFSFKESREFKKKLIDFIEYSIPLYVKEGKSRLVISFGCTGGKHRSVAFAQTVGEYLKEKDYNVNTVHRDIKK
ncbi:MAG: RNase adapter RapZ [Clostridia bacterium]|nr:RNase adapter RapZ [Clostridia bacterium]